MGRGADASKKYAIEDDAGSTGGDVAGKSGSAKKQAAPAPEPAKNTGPRPSTAELQLNVDYATPEEESDIGDPHRSAVVIPGFAAPVTGGSGDEVGWRKWYGENPTSDIPDADEEEAVPKPALGAFNSVNEVDQRAYEQYQHRIAKQLNRHGAWAEAVSVAMDGLEIDNNSKALDKDMTYAYQSWGNQELAAGKYGTAAVIFRKALDDDLRNAKGIVKGLERANKGERNLRVAGYQDLPCAGCFCTFVGLIVLLALIGALSAAPESVCATRQPCMNGAECTDNLVEGTHTCTCAPGWTGADCSVLGGGDAVPPPPPPPLETEPAPLTDAETKQLVGIMLVSAACAAAFGAFWLRIVRSSPHKLVWITFGAAICAQWSFGGALLAGFGNPSGQSNGFGVMFIVASGCTMLLGLVLRNSVPFGVAMFRSATGKRTSNPHRNLMDRDVSERLLVITEVIDDQPAMITVVYIGTVVTLAWLFITGLALTVTGVASGGAVVVYFTYFWVANTIKAAVHCSVAGTTANWYFVTHQIDPVGQATKRAVTTSLGSLAFGSLLVASLQFLQLIKKILNARNSSMSAVGSEAGRPGVFSPILEVFNDFAFVQIAVYGSPYRDAARATADLMKKMGITPVLAQVVIVSGVCMLGCILGGIVGAGVGWSLAVSSELDILIGVDGLQGFGGLCFAFGYMVTMPYMVVLRGVTTSILVCFAQNPYVLKLNNPRLFEEIDDGFVAMTGYGFDEEEYGYEDEEYFTEAGEGEDGVDEESEEYDKQTKKMVRFEP